MVLPWIWIGKMANPEKMVREEKPVEIKVGGPATTHEYFDRKRNTANGKFTTILHGTNSVSSE